MQNKFGKLILPSLLLILLLVIINILIRSVWKDSLYKQDKFNIDLYSQQINSEIEKAVSITNSIKSFFLSSSSITSSEFNTFSKNLLKQYNKDESSLTLEWVDENNIVRYIYPLNEVNKKAIGFDNNPYPNRLAPILLAKETRESVVTEPINLIQGFPGIILYMPIYEEDDYKGLVVSIIKIYDLFSDDLFDFDEVYSPALFSDNTIFPIDNNILYDTKGNEIVTTGGEKGINKIDIGIYNNETINNKVIIANRDWEIRTPVSYLDTNFRNLVIQIFISSSLYILIQFLTVYRYKKQQNNNVLLNNN